MDTDNTKTGESRAGNGQDKTVVGAIPRQTSEGRIEAESGDKRLDSAEAARGQAAREAAAEVTTGAETPRKTPIKKATIRSPRAVRRYESEARLQTSSAEARSRARQDLAIVFENIQLLASDAAGGEMRDAQIVGQIDRLTDAVKGSSFIDPAQGAEILALLGRFRVGRTQLTEYVNGELAPMSDKTWITLRNQTADKFSKLKLTEFKLGEENYIHRDELLRRLEPQLSIARRAIQRMGELMTDGKTAVDAFSEAYQWLVNRWEVLWRGRGKS